MENTKIKGLLVSVLRNGRGVDCSLGGISSKADMLLLVGDGVPEIFEAGEYPVVRLVTRTIGGQEYKHVEPVTGGNEWFMAGGNFCYTSDSRFPNSYPLSIHDRVEHTGGWQD